MALIGALAGVIYPPEEVLAFLKALALYDDSWGYDHGTDGHYEVASCTNHGGKVRDVQRYMVETRPFCYNPDRGDDIKLWN